MNASNGQSNGSNGLTEEKRKAIIAKAQYEARVVEETFAAGVLAAISSGSGDNSEVGPGGYKVYHDRILAATGAAKDPIEAILIQQLLWAHHRIGYLHTASAKADEVDRISALNTAAVKLMNECRKSSLALREYRSPVVPKQVTLVKQQNVASNQQVALVEAEAADHLLAKTAGDSELVSKKALVTHDEPTPIIPKTARREAEPAQTTRFDSRRPSEIERSGSPVSALVTLDRA